jgi:hypothetical protein
LVSARPQLRPSTSGSVTPGPAAYPAMRMPLRPARLACLAAAGEYPWGRPDAATAATHNRRERYRAGRTVFAAVQPYLVTIGIARCRDCPHSAGVIHRSGGVPERSRRHEVRVGMRRHLRELSRAKRVTLRRALPTHQTCHPQTPDDPLGCSQRRRCRSSTVTLRGDRPSPIRARSARPIRSDPRRRDGWSVSTLQQRARAGVEGRAARRGLAPRLRGLVAGGRARSGRRPLLVVCHGRSDWGARLGC